MAAERCFLFMIIICGLAVTLTGCFGTSQSSRFYTLASPADKSGQGSTGLHMAVVIGPVTIPDYLDRKQIVTRSGRNEIVLAEFDRWGGTLDGEISRVLVAGLADRLNSLNIAVLPWSSTPPYTVKTLYRIPVSVTGFDGTLGGKVVLQAAWTVLVKGEKKEEAIIARESTITEEVRGKSYEALVAAMGKAVERLGEEISDSLVAVIGQTKPN
jgi:uncharacterized lipoprotein YmbA